MAARYSRHIPAISLSGDFILLNLLFVAGFYFRTGFELRFFTPQYFAFFAYLNFIWFTLALTFGASRIDRNTTKKAILFIYIRIIVFFFFLFLIYFQVVSLEYYPRDEIKFLFIVFFISLIGYKFLLYYAFYLYRKSGYNYRNVVIVGYTPDSVELSRYFHLNLWHGYRFLGFFDDKKDSRREIVGSWTEVEPFLKEHHVDELYLVLHRIPKDQLPDLTSRIADYPVKIRIVPNLDQFSYKSAELLLYGAVPVIQIHSGPLSYWYNRLLKRVFDIVLSIIIVVGVVSWMSLVLWVLSLLGSRQGVFFTQRRTGIDGRFFSCIKFRTMFVNSEADEQQAVMGDVRVTRVGKFLRKFSLDELPQFINVLSGSMSVIGPRPHMLKHTQDYRRLLSKFMLRHTVKPGITGLAQVNGFRGEIKNINDLKNRVESDVFYVENWSMNMDLRILFLTFWVIIYGQKEAY